MLVEPVDGGGKTALFFSACAGVTGGRWSRGPPVVDKVGPAPHLIRPYCRRRRHPTGSVRPQAAEGRGWNEGTSRPREGGHAARPETRGAARRDGKKAGAKGPQGVDHMERPVFPDRVARRKAVERSVGIELELGELHEGAA